MPRIIRWHLYFWKIFCTTDRPIYIYIKAFEYVHTYKHSYRGPLRMDEILHLDNSNVRHHTTRMREGAPLNVYSFRNISVLKWCLFVCLFVYIIVTNLTNLNTYNYRK
jgi:hypothetical protein